MSRAAKRVWWATWPGAIALGLVSLAMVGGTALVFIGLSLLSVPGPAGPDPGVSSGHSAGRVILWLLLGVVCIGLPTAVVAMARRAWLGWTLVMLVLSGLVLAIALWLLGIL